MFNLTKEQRAAVFILVGLIISGMIYGLHERLSKPHSEITASSPSAAPKPLLIHVSGAVRRPGLYRLNAGSRLINAVEAAGGFLPSADPSSVNLASPLKDGDRVILPARRRPESSSDSTGAGGVNINTADEKTLESIPGVGKVMAGRIVDYRKKNGRFSSAEDLMKIGGVGEKKFEKMKGHVTVN